MSRDAERGKSHIFLQKLQGFGERELPDDNQIGQLLQKHFHFMRFSDSQRKEKRHLLARNETNGVPVDNIVAFA